MCSYSNLNNRFMDLKECWCNGNAEQQSRVKVIIERYPCLDIPLCNFVRDAIEQSQCNSDFDWVQVYDAILAIAKPVVTLLEFYDKTKTSSQSVAKQCVQDALTLIGNAAYLLSKILQKESAPTNSSSLISPETYILPDRSLTECSSSAELQHCDNVTSVNDCEFSHDVIDLEQIGNDVEINSSMPVSSDELEQLDVSLCSQENSTDINDFQCVEVLLPDKADHIKCFIGTRQHSDSVLLANSRQVENFESPDSNNSSMSMSTRNQQKLTHLKKECILSLATNEIHSEKTCFEIKMTPPPVLTNVEMSEGLVSNGVKRAKALLDGKPNLSVDKVTNYTPAVAPKQSEVRVNSSALKSLLTNGKVELVINLQSSCSPNATRSILKTMQSVQTDCQSKVTQPTGKSSKRRILPPVAINDLGQKDYKCPECYAIFSSVSCLQNHALVCPNNTKRYRCLKCESKFKEKDEMQKHYAEFHANFPNDYRCNVCTATFSNNSLLIRHISTSHPLHSSSKNVYNCSKCAATFSAKVHLLSHYEKDHAVPEGATTRQNDSDEPSHVLENVKASNTSILKKFSCDKCEQRFRFKAMLLLHHKTEHPASKEMHVCGRCNEQFHKKVDYRKHLDACHWNEKEKIYPCPECGAAFASKLHLKAHHRIHKGAVVHKCPHCDDTFFSFESEMRNHVIRKHGGQIEKRHKCEVCSTMFAYKADLQKHLSSIHPDRKTYRCVDCNQRFPARKDLRRHAQQAHNRMPAKNRLCPYCPSAFTYNSSLEKHILTHTREKPHKCQECGTSFRQTSSLQVHFATQHSNEKPYKCSNCGDAFATKYKLTCHITSRHGEKPHKCQICGASFLIRYGLKKHLRVHTKERPYKCNECGKGFTEKKGMLSHIRVNHTGEKPFRCIECHEAFPTKVRLHKHAKKWHTS